MGNYKTCSESVFKTLSSNPDFSDIIKVIENNQPNEVVVDSDTPRIAFRKETINGVTTYYADFIPYIPLQITSFNLTESGLKLKGAVVDNLNFSWQYNKPVESQTISGGVSAPLPTSDLSYSLSLTDQNITTNKSYVLTADDNLQDDISTIQSATRSITFGNYIYQTQIQTSDRSDITQATIDALILIDLPKTNKTNRNLTFTCQSNSTEYEVVLVPTLFGLTSGNQFRNDGNNFTGGWSKLFDLNLQNELGFTESYGCWAAVNKNLNGSTFTIL